MCERIDHKGVFMSTIPAQSKAIKKEELFINYQLSPRDSACVAPWKN